MAESPQPTDVPEGQDDQGRTEDLPDPSAQPLMKDEEPELIELDAWPSLDAPHMLGAPRRIDATRATLAYCLVGLLAIVIVGLLILLAIGEVPSENFAEVAGVLVSPLVGLVGAVAGYYYGKSDKS